MFFEWENSGFQMSKNLSLRDNTGITVSYVYKERAQWKYISTNKIRYPLYFRINQNQYQKSIDNLG